MKTVPELLREGADTYEERNKLYGDNYKRHGQVMEALFPTGLELVDLDDHNRFGVFTQMVAKLTRYAENFTHGGHADSVHDLIVYSGMLSELDGELAEQRQRTLDQTEVLEQEWARYAVEETANQTEGVSLEDLEKILRSDVDQAVEVEPPVVIVEDSPQK